MHNSYVEILSCKDDAIIRWGFGRCFSHEGEPALMVVVLLGTLHPFHHMRTQGEYIGYEPGRGPTSEVDHAGPLILYFPAFRTVSNIFLLFISYPVWGIWLQKPDLTTTLLSSIHSSNLLYKSQQLFCIKYYTCNTTQQKQPFVNVI